MGLRKSSTMESEKSLNSNEDNRHEGIEPEWKPSKQAYLVFAVLMILSLMAALDSTVLVPALPTLAIDMQGTATDTFWAGTSYLLTSAILMPIITALSEIFGRCSLLLSSLCFFTAGTLIACLADGFPQLLAGRSVQGVGGGGITAMVMVIFTDIVPLRQRPRYIAIIQLAWALGTIAGPIIGGAFAQHSTWRWIFYINFPFCGIGFVTVPFVVRFESTKDALRTKLARVDWVGGILFIASLSCLLIGITWGGVQYPWGSWNVLVPIATGLAGLFATVLWEKIGAREPFILLALFRGRSAAAIYFCGLIQGLILFAIGYYTAFYLQSVQSLSPVLTGVGAISLFGGLMPTNVICGFFITRTGRFRWSIWSGWVVIVIGTGLLCLLKQDTTTGEWVGIMIVGGLGQGMTLGAMVVAAQATASAGDATQATAMYTFIRALGTCFGVAVGGTIFQNLLLRYLADAGLPEGIAPNAQMYLVELLQMPETSPLRRQIVHQYAKAFQGVFAVLTGLAGLSCLVSLLIKKQVMDRKVESQHVLRSRYDKY